MSRWNDRDDMLRGNDYDERWRRLEANGASIHGEAGLITSFDPRSVLDAGCGTGRVAIELAIRGVEVVGVDLDAAMLASAREKAPELQWVEHDLVDVVVRDSGGERRRFEIVAMPGNVMIFVAPGTEAVVVANLARHLEPGGRLVAGFQLKPGALDLANYDDVCVAAGLQLEHRWATWSREEFVAGGDYAVSVHRSHG